MINRRKGFTLAETLITITIIAILATITFPILQKSKADKDTMIYRKGLYSLQRGIQRFMESPDYEALLQQKREAGEEVVESDYLANFTTKEVCEAIAAQLNTKGKINCLATPAFVTTDGIKFWGFASNGKFPPKTDAKGNLVCRVLYIDSIEELSTGEKNKRTTNGGVANGLRICINYRGKITANGPYERSLIKDFTKMKN